jgi:hypothetical protein
VVPPCASTKARGRILSSVSPDGVRVAFQLDRFEQMGDDRLEVAGRWYGVRGLRFVRPALTVQTEDGERNLLALLDHKPWAAEEGESWIAAFPWEGDSPDPDQAELAVAPSVVVALVQQEDGDTKPRGRSKPALSERLQESETRARRLDSEVAWLREEREALLEDKRAAEQEARQAQVELAGARKAGETAEAERDEAMRARDELAGERQSALDERARIERERKQAESERDDAMRERETAATGRDQALLDLQQVVRERDEARAERDAGTTERDQALEASARALAERDAALGRGSGFPAMSAADLERQPHATSPGRPARQPRGGRHLPDMTSAGWTARALALGALITLLVVVIVLLKVL